MIESYYKDLMPVETSPKREGKWWESYNTQAPWEELYKKYPDTDWNELYSSLPEAVLGKGEMISGK